MIGPCRCKEGYVCVSCRVKRGDYRDWMLVVKRCACGVRIQDDDYDQCWHCRHGRRAS